ncbi:MAG: dockerin type I repeat-containing protein [Oscillospiraceae bacterium]|nr:dockerin type I repeat-containing protein [Oscillospiraceae bacterium]
MGKKFKKLLAAALSLIMLFTFCTVPMTASAETPADEAYETPAEIGFTNLKDGDSYLSGEKSMGVGSKVFTFEADTYSNVVKFTWIAGVTATNEFKVSFDAVGDQISDPFGFGVKASSGATSVDTVVFQNGLNTATKKLAAPVVKDDEHDIELGRKKVLTGSNAGKYYVYLKFDGELIGSEYVSVDENNQYTASNSTVTMLKSIRFVTYGRGGADKIKETPVPETFEAPTEIGFTDLKDDGNYLSGDYKAMGAGSKEFTFDADTYSNVVKFTWIAGVTATNDFKVSFDAVGDQISDPFGFAVKATDGATSIDTVVFQNGLNTATKKLAAPIVVGDEHDIELGRKKVLTGKNTGKYYVYLKFDNELIGEGYVSVDENNQYTASNSTVTMLKSIRFVTYGRGGADKIKEMFVPETLETPTEIGFTDLKDGDGYLSGEKAMGSGSKEFTFDADTYSNVVKFTWIAGKTATNEFKVSFDTKGSDQASDLFGFGVWASNGATSIDTVKFQNLDSAAKKLSAPVLVGDEHDIELGRQKVLTGKNVGKYYVYLKFDNELIGSEYVSVDSNNQYTVSGTTVTMSKSIRFVTFGRGGADKIKETVVGETYDKYDEVTYSDLKNDGQPLASEHTLTGGFTLTYDATSPSYSAVLKFRFIAGSKPGVQFSFDEGASGNIAYPFGAWIKRANSEGAGENGAWHLKPDSLPILNMSEPLVQGKAYDLELGRLKVLTGENTGKYYVYLKVNGELLQEGYSSVDENGYYTSGSKTDCQLSNKIRFGCWGNGGEDKMTASPEIENYDKYDEVTYYTLKKDGQPLASEQQILSGGFTLTYDATSPSYSAVLKFRFIAGSKPGIQFSFDEGYNGNISNPFGAWIKRPDSDGAGANGAWHLKPDSLSMVNMSEPLVQGKAYDLELGRLKVISGKNTGKYYVYLKVNGELIQDGYSAVDANGKYTSGQKTDCQLSNKIRFGCWGNGAEDKMTASPEPENYEAYDEIGYEDLIYDGQPVSGRNFGLTGKNIFTYNRTSDTYSAIFKYRWTVGSLAKFSLSFDTNNVEGTGEESFPFCAVAKYPNQDDYGKAAGPNGAWQIDPSNDSLLVNMSEQLVPRRAVDIEFGRLKVKDGRNAGKYYVYLKVDGELIQSYYATVNEDGTYKNTKLSNNIVFTVYGSEGTKISPYNVELGAIKAEGKVGDFDGDGVVGTSDLIPLKKVILGVLSTSETLGGIADFNNDSRVDVLDFIAMKKEMVSGNTYEKTGSLLFGTQEHLLEDATKTAEYIADASAALGANAYRLSKPIHNLYSATATNGVEVNEENMAQFRAMVNALVDKGITEILYVTDSFILPFGYGDPAKNHNKTVPDPATDTENYIAWLTVNAAAFKALAEEFPEIKYFEPYNEINVSKGSRLEKYGIGWDATEAEQEAYKFTVEERAGIMADLCWYISNAVKSVDPANKVTTPSLSVDVQDSVEGNFLDELYKAIESGAHPFNRVTSDTRIDNYFTIINIHNYADYANSDSASDLQAEVDEWATQITAAYDVVKAHGDGDSRVWLTETGMSTYNPGENGTPRDEQRVANIIGLALEELDTELTFVDAVFLYKIADMSSDKDVTAVEAHYGLFYSGDDFDYPYAAKPSAKTVYSFFNGGTTDYSALDALVSKYLG